MAIAFADPDDISADPLKLLWFSTLRPDLNTKWSYVFIAVNLSLCFLLIVLAIQGALMSYSSDIFFMAECLQTCILMTHGFAKIINLYICKDTLLSLLEKKSKFWNMNVADNDLYLRCMRMTSSTKRIIRYYYGVSLLAAIFFDLQPFSTGYLPTDCYVPEGWFPALTVCLWFLSCTFFFTIQATDGLFCSLCTPLIIQFKLLSYKFKKIKLLNSEIKLWKELKELVDYHNFLLNYSEELNKAFKSVFLLQFLISIASAAVSVFLFMEPGPWTNRIKSMLYFSAVLIETSFYCVSLEIAVNAANEISDAVYDFKWYNVKTNQFKKCLVLILAKTQKTLAFNGYGLVYINLKTFVAIWKTVFTFYTYLNSVRKISK